MLAPRVLNVQRPFDLIFQLGMNLAIWGNVFGLFDQIYGYDKVVHFILPCGSAMMLYIALCHLRLVPDLSEDAGLHDRVAMVLVTLAFGLTVGGIFEMWEWFSNTVFGTEMFVTYGDSIGDLIDDTLGALMGGVILLFWTGRGWGTWRSAGRRPPRQGADADRAPGSRQRPPHPLRRPPRSAAAAAGARVRGGAPLSDAAAMAGGRLGADAPGPRRPDPAEPARRVRSWPRSRRDWEHAARFFFGFGLSALVRLAEAPRPFDAAFALGMAFQAWGAFTGAYDSVTGYEVTARIVASLSIAAMLYLLLVRIRAVPDLSGKTRHPRADGNPAHRDQPRLRRGDALRDRRVGVQRPVRRAAVHIR